MCFQADNSSDSKKNDSSDDQTKEAVKSSAPKNKTITVKAEIKSEVFYKDLADPSEEQMSASKKM